MAYPMTYSFYGTTIPTLRLLTQSAINVLNTAQAEAKASNGKLPSEADLLDARFGDMLPLRYQPIFLSKFPLVALQHLQLHGSAPMPSLDPSNFTSFDSIKTFFTQCIAMYDAVDEKAFNEAAEKSVDIPFESMGKTVKMTGLADYYHCFVMPNAYFHVNAMYSLLRSQGFELGKTVYIGPFFSESQAKDWKALKA
jgi:hypothetical protein